MLTRWLRALGYWAEEIRISHTLFVLPFALASMVVASRDRHGWPGWDLFLLILGAVLLARTCAMVFNRWADVEYDRLNPRTRDRHLASGRLSMRSAVSLWALSAAGFMAVCWFINWTCFLLSPLALLVICFYSLTKRFTDFTHIYLGAALAIAPLGAWIAVTGSLELPPLVLALAVFFWLIGFDLIYSLQDYDFDRRNGLRSLIVRWGVGNALQAAFISHVLTMLLLALFGILLRLEYRFFCLAYFVGLAMIVACLLFEHWLARKRNRRWIGMAFFRLNALISCIFLTMIAVEVAFPFFANRPFR